MLESYLEEEQSSRGEQCVGGLLGMFKVNEETSGQRRVDEVCGVMGNRLHGVILIIRRTLERSSE